MKLRDMLEVAGDFQLKDFNWGEDVVELVKKHIPDCPISLETTGNAALSMIGTAIEDNYYNVLEEYIALDVVEDTKKTEVALSWGKFGIKVTLGTIAGLGSLTAIYETVKTGELPTGETIAAIVSAIAKLFI